MDISTKGIGVWSRFCGEDENGALWVDEKTKCELGDIRTSLLIPNS